MRFSDLWHLFRIGDEVITNASNSVGDALAMKVLRTNGGQRHVHPGTSPSIDSTPLPESVGRTAPVNNINPFCIHAYYLDFNGTSLIPVRRRFVIPPYVGERLITELDVYPLEYALRRDTELKTKLIKRGRNYVKYALSSSRSYCDCQGEDLHTKEELNDKVVVDMKEYYRTYNPPCYTEPEALDMSETSDCSRGAECTLGAECYHGIITALMVHDQFTDKAAMKDHLRNEPAFRVSNGNAGEFTPGKNEDDFAICDHKLFAYKLRSREWGMFNELPLDEGLLTRNSLYSCRQS